MTTKTARPKLHKRIWHGPSGESVHYIIFQGPDRLWASDANPHIDEVKKECKSLGLEYKEDEVIIKVVLG